MSNWFFANEKGEQGPFTLQQIAQLVIDGDLQAGLFLGFAHRCYLWVLALVQEPGRDAPLANLWPHGPAHQQDPPLMHYQDPHPYLGVREVDVAAGGAYPAQLVTHRPGDERRGTARAVNHKRRSAVGGAGRSVVH